MVAAPSTRYLQGTSTAVSPPTSYLDNWVVHLPPNDLATQTAMLDTALEDWEALMPFPLQEFRASYA
jgi:hypothetical protein